MDVILVDIYLIGKNIDHCKMIAADNKNKFCHRLDSKLSCSAKMEAINDANY